MYAKHPTYLGFCVALGVFEHAGNAQMGCSLMVLTPLSWSCCVPKSRCRQFQSDRMLNVLGKKRTLPGIE